MVDRWRARRVSLPHRWCGSRARRPAPPGRPHLYPPNGGCAHLGRPRTSLSQGYSRYSPTFGDRRVAATLRTALTARRSNDLQCEHEAAAEQEWMVLDEIERQAEAFGSHRLGHAALPETGPQADRGQVSRQACELLRAVRAIDVLQAPLQRLQAEVALSTAPAQQRCRLLARLVGYPHTLHGEPATSAGPIPVARSARGGRESRSGSGWQSERRTCPSRAQQLTVLRTAHARV
jgi:hypothetical protein